MFLGHVAAIYAAIAGVVAMAESPLRSMKEEGKAGQGHCQMQLDRNLEQMMSSQSPGENINMIAQGVADSTCAGKCMRLEELFRSVFGHSKQLISLQQRSTEELSPPSCEIFCPDNGCPCLLPWSDRCRLKSCGACPECGGTYTTQPPSSTPPPSSTLPPSSTTPPLSTNPPSSTYTPTSTSPFLSTTFTTTVTTTPTSDCGKDILIAVDASKSVKQDGWNAEVGFVSTLLEALIPNDTPNTNRVMLYYFNNHMYCIGQTCDRNRPGQWMDTQRALASAMTGLAYDTGLTPIKNGATDHPQVYLTAEEAFKTARPHHKHLLIMVTDGVTHEGEGCSSLSQAVLEAKVGKCEGTHACVPGGCDMEKCMCGLYTAELFKEKGFRLDIVGIANQHHIGLTEAGYFKTLMEHMASPNKCNVADEFSHLTAMVPKVVDDACSS
mmetsp:Transcript_62930/g.141803  ORF Transcript_62930/g.141803 Transcript_62930/m.141803 type:complete len:438 (-) Transcript_62930:112-1425(-)